MVVLFEGVIITERLKTKASTPARADSEQRIEE